MVKTKKKRNKPYRGGESKSERPVITKISAVNRNPVSQWWFDRRKIFKPVAITFGVGAIIVVLVLEIIKLLVG